LKNNFICYYAFKGQKNVGFPQMFANFRTVHSTIVRLSSSFKAYNSLVGIITGILNPTDDSISAILVFLKKVKQLAENY